MTTYFLPIPPEEIIRLARSQHHSGAELEIYEEATKDYVIIEQGRGRRTLASHNDNAEGNHRQLVREEAVLNIIRTRVERDFWVLSVVVRRDLGPRLVDDGKALVAEPITLDEFDREFVAPGTGRIRVLLKAQTPSAKQCFDDWWTALTTQDAF